MKIGLIGAGGIAQKHADALSTLDGVDVVAVTDIRRDRAALIAQRVGAAVVDDYRAVIDQSDMVYVLTPPSLRREQVIAAADAGKHIFCEKPIATRIEDAQAMVDAVNCSPGQFMLGHCMRFRRPIIRLKQLIDSGELGTPVSAWCNRMDWGVPMTGNWRIDPTLQCGVTIESLSHDIDLTRWLFGEVASVAASVHQVTGVEGWDDNVTTIMRLRSGMTSTIHVSWTAHVGWNSRGVVGTEGTAVLAGANMWGISSLRWRARNMPDEEQITFGPATASDMGYAAEAQAFISAIREGRGSPVPIEAGLSALRVSQAILRAHSHATIEEVQSDTAN